MLPPALASNSPRKSLYLGVKSDPSAEPCADHPPPENSDSIAMVVSDARLESIHNEGVTASAFASIESAYCMLSAPASIENVGR